MNSYIKIVLLSFIAFSGAFSTTGDTLFKCYRNQVGFAGGMTIGNGLSFRKWFNDKYAIQITGVYFSTTTKYRGLVFGYEKDWINSTGISGLYTLQRWKAVRTFAYFGSSFYSLGGSDRKSIIIDSIIYPYSDGVDYSRCSEGFAAGNGFGIDCYIWHIGLNLMAGLHYGYDLTKKRFIPPSPSLEGGVFFCW
jgi:hypothetical protein